MAPVSAGSPLAAARAADTAVRRRSRMALLALAAAVVALALEVGRLARDLRFNDALARGAYAEAAAGHDSTRGRLAHAFALHRAGEREAALVAYGAVGDPGDPGLRAARRFNLAALYLEQAAAVGESERGQLDLPLIELAKETYREILRARPDDWDARYNLSRALERLPDLGDVEAEEERMPERSPRAPQASRAYERLP